MAMPKARLIVKVERDDSASDGRGVMVTVRDGEHGNYGEPYKVSLAALKGAEVMRAAANVGAAQTHGSTSEQRIDAIVATVWRDGYEPKPFIPKPRAERENVIRPPETQPRVIEPIATLPENDSVNEPVTLKEAYDEVTQSAAATPVAMPTAPHDLLSALGPIGDAIRNEIESKVPTVDLSAFRSEMDAVKADIQESIAKALTEAQRVEIDIRTIVGVNPLTKTHHAMLPTVIRILSVTDGHCFLVGPAGTGKSTIAAQAADAMGLTLYSMSFGPTTPTSKMFGYMDAHGNYVRTPFRDAYEYGGLYLGDELDNGHPGLIAELNQALANGSCAFADGMVKRHQDFRFIATGNTYGKGADRLFIGRNMLDAATLDRFVTVNIDVDEKLERMIAMACATDESREATERWVDQVQTWRKNIEIAKVPVIVSPRASLTGARMLAVGFTADEIAEMKVFAGMSADVRSKVERSGR